MPTDVNHMLENISEITSSKSLNTVHSCKFTFILIGEHVVNTFMFCNIKFILLKPPWSIFE
jgi:hypothetical protein